MFKRDLQRKIINMFKRDLQRKNNKHVQKRSTEIFF